MLKLPEKCFQLFPFRMKTLHGVFPRLELCTQQEGAGECLGEQDGDKQKVVGKDNTLVYLLRDAMLDNREKTGHYTCKGVPYLGPSKKGS